MIAADVSLLSPEAVGTPVTLVVLVSLEREQLDLLNSFKRRIGTYPEVTQCYYVTGVTGDADFILVVRVVSMDAYVQFTERAFFSDKNVRSFHTYTTMQLLHPAGLLAGWRSRRAGCVLGGSQSPHRRAGIVFGPPLGVCGSGAPRAR